MCEVKRYGHFLVVILWLSLLIFSFLHTPVIAQSEDGDRAPIEVEVPADSPKNASDLSIEGMLGKDLGKDIESGLKLGAAKSNIIDLDVKNMDINDVLKLISVKSGANVVVDGPIEGKVTIYLNEIEVRDALRIILDAQGLAFSEEKLGGPETWLSIFRVMTPEKFEKEYGYRYGERVQTRVIPLVYIDDQNVTAVLQEMKSSVGKVIYNPDTKTFVLIDEPGILRSMESFIKQLDMPTDTKIFVLNHSRASQIAESIQDQLTKNIGRMKIDDKANTITVVDTSNNINEIEKLIGNLDRDKRTVQVDAKVIQIILNEEHLAGVDWEAIVSQYKNFAFAGFAKDDPLSPKTKVSLGTISSEDLVILTEALETVGAMQTVLVDQLEVRNHGVEDVTIHVKDVSTFSKETVVSEDISQGDLKFYMTPAIVEGNILSVKVQSSIFVPAKIVEDALNTGSTKENVRRGLLAKGAGFLKSATSVLPGIGDGGRKSIDVHQRQIMEWRTDNAVDIEVEDGESVVIGGLLKEVMVRSMRKVPLLGDLPILGFAFQNQGERLHNTEIIIFLSFKMISSNNE